MFSATRRNSLALGVVVMMRSWWIKDVTMFRSIAHRCSLSLLNLRNAIRFLIVDFNDGWLLVVHPRQRVQ